MYTSMLAALALLGVASAQTTATDLFLVGFDQQPLVGSIIASDATATTYTIACFDPNSDNCGVPPSFTFTQGPSTVHYIYSYVDDTENETIELGCVLTSSESAGTCSGTEQGGLGSSSTSTVTTTSFSNGGSDIGGQIVTLTGGALPGANTAASTTGTASKTGSSASGKTTASSTSGSGTVATGSSSSSTAGVPKITGNAQWVVGGAAAVLALAAL